jgi:hypothetical protein
VEAGRQIWYKYFFEKDLGSLLFMKFFSSCLIFSVFLESERFGSYNICVKNSVDNKLPAVRV